MAIQLDDLIIETIPILFRDVNALLEVMNSLTDNYRLLVGAAEELTRIPGATQESINYALDRADNAGTLIDLVIFTLALKLDFVIEVLNATGIPLDLVIGLFAKTLEAKDTCIPRDPANLLPHPENPFPVDFPNRLRVNTLSSNKKWEKRHQQWEKRKKKWTAKRKVKKCSS